MPSFNGIRASVAMSAILSFGLLQTPGENKVVDVSMAQLWSADASQRQAGKERLTELGGRATNALSSLLEDIIEHPRPRYEIGKEEEASAAWESLKGSLVTGDVNWPEDSVDRLRSFDINSRLERDCIELLVRKNPEDVIPLLLKLVRRDEPSSLAQWMRPAMGALIELGPKAVPKLCEAIGTVGREQETSLILAAGMTEEKRRRNGERLKDFFARVAIVLGEIGDARALPVLEPLVLYWNERGITYQTYYVEQAIRKIKTGSN